jgi:hypothetical protein
LCGQKTAHKNGGCCTTKKWAIGGKIILEIAWNLRFCEDENEEMIVVQQAQNVYAMRGFSVGY